MVTAPIAGVLGITIMWLNLGLPRVALNFELDDAIADTNAAITELAEDTHEAITKLAGEIGDLKQYSTGTLALLLDQAWWRAKDELENVHARLRGEPRDRDLLQLKRSLDRQLHELNLQLKAIRGDG